MITVEIVSGPAMASLQKVSRAFSSADVVAVVLAGANVVAEEAARLAPVKTGALRASIKTNLLPDGSVAVGSDLPYARRIEFGFNAADSRGRRYHQAAQPYLRPAKDTTRAQQARASLEASERLLKANLK